MFSDHPTAPAAQRRVSVPIADAPVWSSGLLPPYHYSGEAWRCASRASSRCGERASAGRGSGGTRRRHCGLGLVAAQRDAIGTAGSTMAGQDVEDLHAFRQLDQEFGIALQMVNAPRVIAGKARHRLHALPVRDRHKFGLAGALLTQQLHAERLLDERLDPVLVEIAFVLVGLFVGRATSPDPGDHRAHTTAGIAHPTTPSSW